jgi:hypothetical protein
MKEIHDSVASRKDLFVPPQFALLILFGVIAVLRLEGAISGTSNRHRVSSAASNLFAADERKSQIALTGSPRIRFGKQSGH